MLLRLLTVLLVLRLVVVRLREVRECQSLPLLLRVLLLLPVRVLLQVLLQVLLEPPVLEQLQ